MEMNENVFRKRPENAAPPHTTHARARAHTHAYARTHARAHTHTHTHTHTRVYREDQDQLTIEVSRIIHFENILKTKHV